MVGRGGDLENDVQEGSGRVASVFVGGSSASWTGTWGVGVAWRLEGVCDLLRYLLVFERGELRVREDLCADWVDDWAAGWNARGKGGAACLPGFPMLAGGEVDGLGNDDGGCGVVPTPVRALSLKQVAELMVYASENRELISGGELGSDWLRTWCESQPSRVDAGSGASSVCGVVERGDGEADRSAVCVCDGAGGDDSVVCGECGRVYGGEGVGLEPTRGGGSGSGSGASSVCGVVERGIAPAVITNDRGKVGPSR